MKIFVALFIMCCLKIYSPRNCYEYNKGRHFDFQRFISSSGSLKNIYKDSTMIFKKTDEDLQDMCNFIKNPKMINYFDERRIEWKFMVERAAWRSGFY